MKSDGFALPVTIFVVLVLAALGLFAMRVGVGQLQQQSLDLAIVRAQAAADAGIEYAANRALKVGGGAAGCQAATAANPLSLPAPALAGFRIVITCQASQHNVVGSNCGALCWIYGLTATATLGAYGTPGYVARTSTRWVTNTLP